MEPLRFRQTMVLPGATIYVASLHYLTRSDCHVFPAADCSDQAVAMRIAGITAVHDEDAYIGQAPSRLASSL